jgi:hypothetical protein
MLHERLTENEAEWGLTRIEFGLLERRKEQARRRAMRSRYLAQNVAPRERNEHGRFIALPLPAASIAGAVWDTTEGIRAYTEKEPRILVWGLSHRMVVTRVSLPYVSIQHHRTS